MARALTGFLNTLRGKCLLDNKYVRGHYWNALSFVAICSFTGVSWRQKNEQSFYYPVGLGIAGETLKVLGAHKKL